MALSARTTIVVVASVAVLGIAALLVVPAATNRSAPGPTPSATAADDMSPCAAPVDSAAPDAVFDGLPYATDPGTPQHEDCRTVADDATTGFDFGQLAEPPSAIPAAPADVDVIAHFYNDFGLDSTLADPEWNGWYDWRWNFPTNLDDTDPDTEYDPARHPLLGFYKGDDPDALGWISYWLASAGVTAVSIQNQNGFTDAAWPNDSWEQRFLEDTPNSAALKTVLALGNVGTTTEIEARAQAMLAWYTAHPDRVLTVPVGGAEYAAVNVWDLEALRGVYDHYEGSGKTRAFLTSLAADFRAAGFGGLAIQARGSGTLGTVDAAPIANAVVIASTYEGTYPDAPGQATAATYQDYVDGVTERYDAAVPTTKLSMLGVTTSAVTQKPHPSDLHMAGSTPALFAELLATTKQYIAEHDGLVSAITIDNVSEWAESGPGLIPQHRDGFGYLEAVRAQLGE